MHEVAIAQEIIEIVKSYLPNEDNVYVKSVKIDLGDFSNILPEALKFSFDVLLTDTELKGAKLEITKIPLKIKCSDCGHIAILDEPFFFCPDCSSPNVEILSGTELKVVEIELKEINNIN